MAKKVVCDYDCSNCKYDDCKVNGITPTERKAMRMRDESYFDNAFVRQKRKRKL